MKKKINLITLWSKHTALLFGDYDFGTFKNKLSISNLKKLQKSFSVQSFLLVTQSHFSLNLCKISF